MKKKELLKRNDPVEFCGLKCRVFSKFKEDGELYYVISVISIHDNVRVEQSQHNRKITTPFYMSSFVIHHSNIQSGKDGWEVF